MCSDAEEEVVVWVGLDLDVGEGLARTVRRVWAVLEVLRV